MPLHHCSTECTHHALTYHCTVLNVLPATSHSSTPLYTSPRTHHRTEYTASHQPSFLYTSVHLTTVLNAPAIPLHLTTVLNVLPATSQPQTVLEWMHLCTPHTVHAQKEPRSCTGQKQTWQLSLPISGWEMRRIPLCTLHAIYHRELYLGMEHLSLWTLKARGIASI